MPLPHPLPAPLPTRSYPAKVILFGEYTVLLGGSILAVPYPSFAAKWVMSMETDTRLIDYIDHLISADIDTLKVNALHHLKQLAADGLILESNLKTGAGLGSSGTVVAAIYDYCKVSDDLHLGSLLETFVKMESYFHGQSSGIDPLVSYTQSAVLLADGEITLYTDLTIPQFDLYDSNISRDTKVLVGKFKERLSTDSEFEREVETLKQVNDRIIISILEGQFDHSQVKQLSDLQLETMQGYIPDSIKDKWQSDANTTWKICGAAGGGYFLRLL